MFLPYFLRKQEPIRTENKRMERDTALDQTAFNRLLSRVEKPARYIGGEWNSIVKPEADIRFALLFPDVYEIGMSHLGSRIL